MKKKRRIMEGKLRKYQKIKEILEVYEKRWKINAKPRIESKNKNGIY